MKLGRLGLLAAAVLSVAAISAPAAHASYRAIGTRGGFLAENTADGTTAMGPNGEIASLYAVWFSGDDGGTLDPNG